MRETKWTPGPWEVALDASGHPNIRAQSRRVAYLDLRGDLAAVDANARLVAAAPDLYEALDGLVSRLKQTCGDYHAQGIEIAERALARARGDS